MQADRTTSSDDGDRVGLLTLYLLTGYKMHPGMEFS